MEEKDCFFINVLFNKWYFEVKYIMFKYKNI